jgi:hypothetical protein
MSSLRLGFGFAIVSSLLALLPTVNGCASTYPTHELPPPRDFSVDVDDMAGDGTGGNGGDDMAVPADMASDGTGGNGGDMAAPTPADLAIPAADLAHGCAAGGGLTDADGGVVPTLWLAAPTATGLFAARLRGGTWTTLAPTAGNVDDVALATVHGRPLVAARLHDATLAAATYDDCRDGFTALTAIAAAASTAARPALAGGAAGDIVFRGSVNGDQRYYWAHFDGATWGAIATQGNFLSSLAPTATRVGSAVHTVFAGTDKNLYDGVVQTTGGGASTQLTGNTSMLAPAAAVAPDGTVHVVYTGTNQHIYWTTTAAPATVHDLCDGQAAGCFIVTDAAPALTIAADGGAVAVFHGTDGKLYASRLTGTQWGAATALTGSETTTIAPALLGGVGDSLANVVYVRASDGAARHVALTAAGWQAAITVVGGTLTGAPALAATP